ADMLNDQRGEFDQTTSRTTELLHTQVQRFETLLSDLLEISRYDAGSVQLELEATSLAHLAEDIIEQMKPLADERGSELRLVAPGGYSPVDMDPRRVRRVLRNLVGNAIEHGEGRPIVVTVDSNQHA
ncbi:HAMP domain-containing histidine kinase, partial [Pseudomonas sp. BGM005]|nr:HAMP domain-containing histidine kinase [Pseudomonas sp. BG5]